MGHRPSKDALYDGPASVAKALGSGRRAGLVDVLAQGERRVDDLAVEIGLTTAHAANVDQLAEAYLGDRSDLDAVSRDQLLDRLGAGDVVLDVRPQADFAAGTSPERSTSRLRSWPSTCASCRTASRSLPTALLEDGYPEWASAGLPVERVRA
jgi:rhodanese-related sulfurtransferase